MSEVYAPVSGTIASVNSALEENPELINSGPYEDGWVLSIKPDDPGDLEKLLSPEAYEKLLEEV